MLLLWTCVLVSSAAAHRVTESEEDPAPNTTTLYPVTNDTRPADTKLKSATSWKIETTFGESKLDSNSSSTESKEAAVDRPENSSQEFRPSQHLGDFVDEDILPVLPTRGADVFNPVLKKPPTGFINSHRESYKSSYHKIPKEVLKSFQQFPYKFDPPILTRAKDDWKPSAGTAGSAGATSSKETSSNSLEPKPTVEAPVRVPPGLPAGGLYKSPDPFRVKPGTTDDDFGLDFSADVKENPIKKRVSPWHNLLHFLTALIPVGIIFSALSPNVITIEPEAHAGPGNPFRRGDGSFAPVPSISERCRRRLLCELHSESNYNSSRRGKKCHRLQCEDPAALEQTLRWLLAYRQPSGPSGASGTSGPSGTSGYIGDHFT